MELETSPLFDHRLHVLYDHSTQFYRHKSMQLAHLKVELAK